MTYLRSFAISKKKMKNIFRNQASFLLEQYEFLTSMDLRVILKLFKNLSRSQSKVYDNIVKSEFNGEAEIYRYKITERSLYLLSKPLHESTINPNSSPIMPSHNEFKFLCMMHDEDLESVDEQTLVNIGSLNSSNGTLVANDSIRSCNENDHLNYIEGELVKNDTVCIQSSIQLNNVVESPYNKRDLDISPDHYRHLLPNKRTSNGGAQSSSNSKSTLILDYINSLKEEINLSSESSSDFKYDESESRYKPGKSDSLADSRVRAVRNKLYAFLINNLDALMHSETRLKQFRDRFIFILDRHDDMSAEEFVHEAFEFFNTDLFFKLLTASTVTIEWSQRLKS